MAVRLGTELSRCARKQLGMARHLRMDLKANYDLPLAGIPLDAVC
jgi:hypothetical protein